jgi:hypothetical protein
LSCSWMACLPSTARLANKKLSLDDRHALRQEPASHKGFIVINRAVL